MKDGAHTHHGHGSGGLGLALSIAAGLVLASVIQSILPVLLIVLAVATGLAVVGLIARVITTWSYLDQAALTRQVGYPHLPTGEKEQAQMAAAPLTHAGLPMEQHQHLHFHGLDPAQVAAILAAQHQQVADEDGDAR